MIKPELMNFKMSDHVKFSIKVHVLKAMRHPYIITYKESFMDKRCLCIVMDYADGGDLYTKIANQKKIGRGKPNHFQKFLNF